MRQRHIDSGWRCFHQHGGDGRDVGPRAGRAATAHESAERAAATTTQEDCSLGGGGMRGCSSDSHQEGTS